MSMDGPMAPASDAEDAADMAPELAYVLVELAIADGADPAAICANGLPWKADDAGGFAVTVGEYARTFTADEIAAAMSDEEAEEPPADAEQPA